MNAAPAREVAGEDHYEPYLNLTNYNYSYVYVYIQLDKKLNS